MTPLKNVLVAADLTDPSIAAIQAGLRLADAEQASTTIFHALDLAWLESPSPLMPVATTRKDYVQREATHARTKLEEMIASWPRALRPTITIEASASPARAICKRATEGHHDLVVLGTNERKGLSRFFLGSVAEMVTRHAPCSALIVPQDATLRTTSAKRIIAAIDFSDSSLNALDRARALTKSRNAELRVAHVVRVPPVTSAGLSTTVAGGIPHAERVTADRGRVQSLLDERYGADHGAEVHISVGADVARPLANLSADVNADLLVVGTHGRTGVARWLMGSVAERVVRHAPCSVLVVR